MLDVIKPFILEGDASKLGVGLFILMPEGRAITFFSEAFYSKTLAISAYDWELIAFVLANNH